MPLIRFCLETLTDVQSKKNVTFFLLFNSEVDDSKLIENHETKKLRSSEFLQNECLGVLSRFFQS